jgi:hypothetical protein
MIDDKDQIEDFSFKPLSEGLGFHRHSQNEKEVISPNPIGMANMDFEISDKKETLKIVAEPIRTQGSKSEAQATSDSVEKWSEKWNESYPNWSAMLLDGLLITAIYLISMVLLIKITDIDLFANLSSPDDSNMIFVSMIVLFLSIHFVYLLLNRTFLGYTAGEWIFDQRLGLPSQINEFGYIDRVLIRSFLLFLTGILPVTIASSFLKRDILGKWSKLKIVKKSVLASNAQN